MSRESGRILALQQRVQHMMEEYDEDNKDTKEETMSEQNGRRSTSPAAIKELAVGETNDDKLGIMHPKALMFCGLWYLFSSLTLFLNKYIVDIKKGDAGLLGVFQMVMITLGGAVNMYFPCGLYQKQKAGRVKPAGFYKNMIFIGGLRFLTVILGLIALKYVAVSFTETVKSSAPLFTVGIAKVMLGENTSCAVLLSLIPIMGGLALTSVYEVSFNFIGLLAALGTNFSECVQNVAAKMLFNASDYVYTPAEMQFYTSACSMVIQIPVAFFMIDYEYLTERLDSHMVMCLFINGIFFHGQTITAYGLMGYISPVTHSVANTVKRALMIVVSVFIFGNEITLLAGVGMGMVTVGVFIYNKARERESELKQAAGKYP